MSEEPKGERTVLVLDDDVAVQRAVTRILTRSGYDVLAAATAREALDLVDKSGVQVDLLICDLILTGLGGREAANTLRARAPDLKVLYMSGYSSHHSGRRDLVGAGEPFIGKPFEPADLVKAVGEVLRG